MRSTLIRHVTLVNEGRAYLASVLVEGEHIARIIPHGQGADGHVADDQSVATSATGPAEAPQPAESIETGDCMLTEVDGTGCYLLPGVIDEHVHFRDPGLTQKADIATESRAAAAGGVTAVMDMPNTSPQTTTLEALEAKLAAMGQHCRVNYSAYLGATNTNTDLLGRVDRHRTCGVKVFMGSSTGGMLVDRQEALRRIFGSTDLLIAAHCEDQGLISAQTNVFKALRDQILSDQTQGNPALRGQALRNPALSNPTLDIPALDSQDLGDPALSDQALSYPVPSANGSLGRGSEDNAREQARRLTATYGVSDAVLSALMDCRTYAADDLPLALHPLIRSAEACYRSSALAVRLAQEAGARLHLMHISTARELDLLQPGPPEGKRITGEACLAHLLLTDADYSRLGARMKCNPAVKTRADRDAIRQALRDGRIDTIATDHAPHLLSDKQGGALRAASGMPMVQFSLVSMLGLVDQGVLSLPEVVEKMCHAPARLYGIRGRGFLRRGYQADMVLVRPLEQPWTLTASDVLSKCGWSPLEGRSFRWRVEKTWVNGHLAYADGQVQDDCRGQELFFR